MAYFDPIQRPLYATPKQVRRIIGTQDQSTNDDDILMAFAEEAARMIDQECNNRRFYPRYQTLKSDWQGNSFVLQLPDDLISLTTLTNGDGNVIPATSGGSDVILYYPSSEYPRYQIQLAINSGYVFLFTGTPQQAISINGLWGYPAYEETGQWSITTAGTVQNIISQNASTTTLLTQTELFQAGQTLCIDSEFEIIQSLVQGTTNDTLTVLRGACGSTAAAHTNGTAISQVIVHPTIRKAMWRLTSLAYRTKDDAGFGTVGIQQFGQLILPNSLPADIKGILGGMRRSHNWTR